MSPRSFKSLIFSLTLLLVWGCDSAPSTQGGKLEVWLHDAPTDLDEVQIYVERVEIGKQGETTDLGLIELEEK